MDTLKKIIASFSAFALFLSVAVAPTMAATFSDLAGHWAEDYVEELVEMGYVSTDHSTYRPDDKLNRAELVKLAVEASGGIIVDLVPETATFTDVAKGAWYYEYVETAYALDIVNGYGDGRFGPSDHVTREQAVKILVNALGVPTKLSPSAPFSDVKSTDWAYNFITTAYNQCIVDGYADGRFGSIDNVTRGQVAKMLVNSMNPTTDCRTTDPGDDDTPGDDDDDDDDDDVTPPAAVSDGTLEVSISADNPAGQTIPQNGTNVPYLVLDFTAGQGEDVEVTALTVSLNGLGSRDRYGDVKVYDGLEQLGSGRTFSSATNSAAINLSTDPIEVKAGTTKRITVVADIDSVVAGDENYFSINSVASVGAFGADTGGTVEVAGDFPVQGNIMTIGTINVGALAFEAKTTANKVADIGENNVNITRFEVRANNAEDVLIKAMKFRQRGNANVNDIANIKLMYGDTQLGETVSMLTADKRVTFDLTGMTNGGWLLESSAARTLYIYADILNGIGNEVYFDIDNAQSDVIAEGLTYGFNVAVANWDSVTNCGVIANCLVTIQGGALNFAFSSTAREVPADRKNIEFGILKIDNKGEPITIKEFDLIANVVGGNTNVLKNIRFVDSATGIVVSGPSDMGPGVATATKDFKDDFFIDSGETVNLQLLADVAAGALPGAKYHFELDIDTVQYKGVTSGEPLTCIVDAGKGADCRPGANPLTQAYTIAAASLKIAGRALAAQNYVAQSKDITFWEGSFRAGSAEDIIIRQLTFTTNTASGRDNVQNLAIYAGGTPQEAGKAMSGGAGAPVVCNVTDCTVSFSSLRDDGASGITIKAGQEITVRLAGDIAPTLVGAAPTVAYTLTAANVDAENLDGKVVAMVAGDVTNGLASTMTLKPSGTLKVTLNTSKTPEPAILLAGAENVEVAVFELEAFDEEAIVQDLTVLIGEVKTSASVPTAINDAAGYVIGNTILILDSTAGMSVGEQLIIDEGGASEEVVTISAIAAPTITITPGLTKNQADNATVRSTNDILNDSRAIYSVALFNAEAGTPILNTNGGNASTSSIGAGGKALLSGLDLSVKRNEKKLLGVYVSLNDIGRGSIAKSGMVFNTALSFNQGAVPAEFKIKGVSGADYLTVGAIGSGDQIETNDGTVGLEKTNNANNMFVLKNKVTATKTTGQPTILANGDRDGLRFTLTPSGSGTAHLGGVKVNVTLTDGAAGAPALGVTGVDLYSGSDLIGNGVLAAGEWTINLIAGAPNVLIAGQWYNEIKSESTIYTIRANGVTGVGDNDSINFALDVNTREVATIGRGYPIDDDDIMWRDYGTDGTDGMDIDWIDLGADKSTSTIENQIKFNN